MTTVESLLTFSDALMYLENMELLEEAEAVTQLQRVEFNEETLLHDKNRQKNKGSRVANIVQVEPTNWFAHNEFKKKVVSRIWEQRQDRDDMWEGLFQTADSNEQQKQVRNRQMYFTISRCSLHGFMYDPPVTIKNICTVRTTMSTLNKKEKEEKETEDGLIDESEKNDSENMDEDYDYGEEYDPQEEDPQEEDPQEEYLQEDPQEDYGNEECNNTYDEYL